MKTADSTISLEEEISLLRRVNQNLEATVLSLQEQLNWFKKQLFGKKSERFIADDNQLYFPGLELPPSIEPVEKTIDVPAHKKKQGNSASSNGITFPEDLPIEEVILDLPEDQRIDPVTGNPLVYIGEEVSQKLGKKAASYFIKKIIRKKYAVMGRPEEGIFTPSLPDSVIPRCAVDESIIADVLAKKFCDHLPLYRQVEMMQRDGVKISRQTLSSYVLEAGKALTPLYDLLEAEILSSGNIFIDETPIDMLAPGTGKVEQGYMVALIGGKSLDPPTRIYKFFTSRKYEGFEKLLSGYKGVFHSDKYGAYEQEAKKDGVIWVPCWAHIRRKFVEAEGDPTFQQEMLIFIEKLFSIEEEIKDLEPGERVCIRKTRALPIIDKLLQKVQDRANKGVLPKSKLARAIGYVQGLTPYLKNYIEYPYARLDNNVAERALKLVVIGRKNWLFVGNEGGGKAAAIVYSLAQTCRALKINPYKYFEDVLRRLQAHPYNRLSELLPGNWKA
ncbi:MAG: IS66 family transposase [Chlamydiae bacterium]|jgi:transposase|nr:IS66 family transposase [Chlamydiota bacterium]MBM3197799.1 IS66 family transposase [Chlamydiota bacterium]